MSTNSTTRFIDANSLPEVVRSPNSGQGHARKEAVYYAFHDGRHQYKEVVRPSVYGNDLVPIEAGVLQIPDDFISDRPPPKYSTKPTFISSLRRKRVWVPALLIIVAVAVTVPLVFRFLINQSNSSPGDRGSASNSPNPSNSSTSATTVGSSLPEILDGTRLSVLNNYDGDDMLFYQLPSGGIQFVTLSDQGFGDAVDLGVTNARSQTPLATISQNLQDGSKYWWLLYVDDRDTIQGLYSSETPNEWILSSINAYSYNVSNRPDAAFAVGHRSYDAASSTPSGFFTFNFCNAGGRLREVIYDAGFQTWRDGFADFASVEGCTYASVAETAGTTYLLMRTRATTALRTWARATGAGNDDMAWQQQAETSVLDALSASSFCTGEGYLAYQGTDGSIRGSTFEDGGAGDGALRWGGTFVIDAQPARNLTGLACRYRAGTAVVVYQALNGTLVSATRVAGTSSDIEEGEWAVELIGEEENV